LFSSLGVFVEDRFPFGRVRNLAPNKQIDHGLRWGRKVIILAR
jgi:hypothetical protein